jgi:hypothetical protein
MRKKVTYPADTGIVEVSLIYDLIGNILLEKHAHRVNFSTFQI